VPFKKKKTLISYFEKESKFDFLLADMLFTETVCASFPSLYSNEEMSILGCVSGVGSA
jgi:hypothetical protein